MKQRTNVAALCLAAAAFFAASCNSGENKTSTASGTSDSSTAKMETPSPMPSAPANATVLRIVHKVANFAKWKAAYDAHDSDRLAAGIHNYVIARGTEDSNTVLVALKMNDVEKAKKWSGSPGLKERMTKGGVTGPVEKDFTTMVMNDTTSLQQMVRLSVIHKVKDWDAWKKVYDSDKQNRMDAGLTDRVLARSVDDPHKVFLVFAVADVAKAKAFSTSKALKDKMEQGGVEGAPEVFFYKIVQKY